MKRPFPFSTHPMSEEQKQTTITSTMFYTPSVSPTFMLALMALTTQTTVEASLSPLIHRNIESTETGISINIPTNNSSNSSNIITLGMVSGTSAFFDPVQDGWETACDEMGPNVQCIYVQPNEDTIDDNTQNYSDPCISLIDDLIDIGVDALALHCVFDDNSLEVYERAANNNIPLVAFDGSHPPENFPIDAYVGTDNAFMGRTLARLTKQLHPEGGTFGLVYRPGQMERVNAFREELTMENDRDEVSNWYEIQPVNPDDPSDDGSDLITDIQDHSMEIMDRLAIQNPTAIIFMYQTPMRSPDYPTFIDENRHRNITFIGTDGSDYQLEYLTRRYVNGLVGQLPYDMGYFSAQKLFQLIHSREVSSNEESNAGTEASPETSSESADGGSIEIIPTNLVSYNLIPNELPPLNLEENLLGNLVYIGFACFCVLIISSLACIVWTVWNWKATVVQASQPLFLIMLAVGVIMMAAALIPLSYDDNGEITEMPTAHAIGACMSIPWLLFIGFTVTFSALFSKTWRINKLVQAASSFSRVSISEMDVLKPFLVLFTLNIIILVSWTVIDPLMYQRHFLRGTDEWNREFESVGTCGGEHSAAFLIPLSLVNFGVVMLSCWQAWQARNITCELSEAKYIGLAVFSICQAFLTGIPIVAIVRNIPEAFYLVLTFLIFILCMVLLALIFLPKVMMHRNYAKMSLSEQRQMIQKSLRASHVQHSTSRSYIINDVKSSLKSPSPGSVGERSLHATEPHLQRLEGSLSSSSRNSNGRNRSVRFSVGDSISMTANSGVRRSINLDMQSIDEESCLELSSVPNPNLRATVEQLHSEGSIERESTDSTDSDLSSQSVKHFIPTSDESLDDEDEESGDESIP